MPFEILGVIILSLALAVVLFAYERLLRENRGLRRNKDNLELSSREQAAKLVREAREKAVGILGEAKVDVGKWQEVMDQELDKLIQAQIIEYKERLHNVSKSVEEEVKNEAGDLRKALEMETIEAEKAAAVRLQEEYARVDKQIEEYRQTKLTQIEKNITDVLKEVSRKFIGKTINFDDQTDMIIEALEKAKNQNVI
jgi:hypothetical protein